MNINTLALLRHLNIRKEGDEKVLAIDLKLECQIDAGDLIEFHPSLRSVLWSGDDPRFAGLIESVQLVGELRHYEATVQKLDLQDCRLRRFVVTPLPQGKADLAFTLTTHPESGRTVAVLSELVADQVALQVGPEGDLLSDASSAKALEQAVLKKLPGCDLLIRSQSDQAKPKRKRSSKRVPVEAAPDSSERSETRVCSYEEWPFPGTR